jgi:hypothetical protein
MAMCLNLNSLGFLVRLAVSTLLVMMLSLPSLKMKKRLRNPPRKSELPWDVVASLLFSFLVSWCQRGRRRSSRTCTGFARVVWGHKHLLFIIPLKLVSSFYLLCYVEPYLVFYVSYVWWARPFSEWTIAMVFGILYGWEYCHGLVWSSYISYCLWIYLKLILDVIMGFLFMILRLLSWNVKDVSMKGYDLNLSSFIFSHTLYVLCLMSIVLTIL